MSVLRPSSVPGLTPVALSGTQYGMTGSVIMKEATFNSRTSGRSELLVFVRAST